MKKLLRSIATRVFGRGKRKPTSPTPTTPPSASGWYFLYGKNEPVIADDGSFVWASEPYSEIDYLLHPHGPLLPTQTLTITYKIEPIEGSPAIHSTECTATQNPAARAALFLGCGNNSTLYDRAWRNDRPLMTFGTHVYSAPLGDGTGWGFVYEGATLHPKEWAYMLANLKTVGLTFNGCSSAGHGAYVVSGKVKFTLISIEVK